MSLKDGVSHCTFCGKLEKTHVQGKCLFEATDFEPCEVKLSPLVMSKLSRCLLPAAIREMSDEFRYHSDSEALKHARWIIQQEIDRHAWWRSNFTSSHTVWIPSHGRGMHISMENFKYLCYWYHLRDVDGVANYATATEAFTDFQLYPSDVVFDREMKSPIFTHVAWFDR